jgi:sugar O-acyltransferase (sialic acid O-acetyltransferase NeuD family)
LSDLDLNLQQSGQPIPVLVFGGGGQGKCVIDLIRTQKAYRVAGVIDDALPAGASVLDTCVVGSSEDLAALRAEGIPLAAVAVGGLRDISVRVKAFDRMLAAGFELPCLIHPTGFVEPSARLGGGTHLFPHTYAGSDVRIGFGVLLNTGVIISHDCQIGDYTNISPGAVLAGAVTVGQRVLIGMGVTINLGVRIGDGARIANGATVKSDVPTGGIVHAGQVW